MCTYLALYEIEDENYAQARKKIDDLFKSSHIFIRNGVSVIVSGPHAQHVLNNLNLILNGNLHSLIVVHIGNDIALQLPPEECELQKDMETFFQARHSKC